MNLKLGMQQRVLGNYQVCSNDAPGLTVTYFTARSNLVPYAFVWEKVKTMLFCFVFCFVCLFVVVVCFVFLLFFVFLFFCFFVCFFVVVFFFFFFSEIIVVYDIKVDRCSQINEYMKLYEYQRSRSFFDLGPSHSDPIFLIFFSSVTADFNISSALR